MTAGNLDTWEITNKTYQDIETITGETLAASKYLIQVRGRFSMCRKETTPKETEGFVYENTEKTFEYVPGTPNLYLKSSPFGNAFVNIDEQEAEATE